MDVTVGRSESGDMQVKLQANGLELNLSASLDDILKLRTIRSAHWGGRRSIRAGRSAGSRAFWCCSGETVTVLIGEDDETWDVAVDIPISVVDEIIAKAITANDS